MSSMPSPKGVVARTSRCPVCGELSSPTIWRCERCETPHHTECAQYFGGCAIFGCRDGQLPARMEIRSWPAAARRLDELLSVRRYQTASLVAMALCAGIPSFVIPFACFFLQDFWFLLEALAVSLLQAAVFVFGSIFCLTTVLAERRLGALRAVLRTPADTHLDLPRFRLAFRAPARVRRSAIAWGLSALGWLGSALVAVAAIEDIADTLTIVGWAVPALVVLGASRALDAYALDRTTFAARIEATFSPLLTDETKPQRSEIAV